MALIKTDIKQDEIPQCNGLRGTCVRKPEFIIIFVSTPDSLEYYCEPHYREVTYLVPTSRYASEILS